MGLEDRCAEVEAAPLRSVFVSRVTFVGARHLHRARIRDLCGPQGRAWLKPQDNSLP